MPDGHRRLDSPLEPPTCGSARGKHWPTGWGPPSALAAAPCPPSVAGCAGGRLALHRACVTILRQRRRAPDRRHERGDPPPAAEAEEGAAGGPGLDRRAGVPHTKGRSGTQGAVPLLWASSIRGELHRTQNTFEESLLRLLVTLLPPRVTVSVLADRGFSRAMLAQTCHDLKVRYLIRKPDVRVAHPSYTGRPDDYPLRKGCWQVLTGAEYRGDTVVTRNVGDPLATRAVRASGRAVVPDDRLAGERGPVDHLGSVDAPCGAEGAAQPGPAAGRERAE